jgi:putative DNA primase/helicase
MEWERRRQEQAHVYTAYAKELQKQFDAGYLAELIPYRHFIVWKAVQTQDKCKKPPYNPRTHRLASAADPTSWGSVQEALAALQSGAYNGIGFVFSEADPFASLDLDKCVHDNRQINFREEQLIRQIQSYAEYSPNDGAHLIVKAELPFHTLKRGNLEIFNSRHSLSLTLRHIPGTPATIEDRQAELNALVQSLAQPESEHPTPRVIWQQPQQQQEQQQLSEVERKLLEHWKSQPGNFRRYFDGDQSLWLAGSQHKVYSKSEAAFVLCLMLLTKTQDDTEQVKRLFRASGLFDPLKTDRISGHDPQTGRPVTYLEMTIFNALKKRGNTPKSHS